MPILTVQFDMEKVDASDLFWQYLTKGTIVLSL